MSEDFLVSVFEHNHWANLQILQACATLTDAQLDAPPTSATYGTIRQTLLHFVGAQAGYLRTLTVSAEERRAKAAKHKAVKGPKELQGPEGPEPTRFGDWERKGLASDF